MATGQARRIDSVSEALRTKSADWCRQCVRRDDSGRESSSRHTTYNRITRLRLRVPRVAWCAFPRVDWLKPQIRPQVRPAHAREGDSDDGIGRGDDFLRLAALESDVA